LAADLLYRDGLAAYRVTAVIPMSDLDDEIYPGILEVESLS
jgi:hypothetical protein